MESRQSNDPDHGVEDMINLSILDESTILQNLVVRYGREQIYTFTGSILVSVNPYKMFNIYGLDMVKKYEGQPLGSLPPHLFAIGSVSYSRMLKEKENQVIIISGESGAGKTEATKLVMQYLAAVNKSGNNLITEQILEANPLLESFGNAKTIRNDNSSRFGKYIEVFFKTGSIVGARTLEYLLEKSRIVTQAQDERNYHVFYEMLSGMSQETKNKYGLQSASKYFYLNQGGSHELMGRDDVENYRILMGAFDVLNFPRNEQETIMKILSSVLHLGNIYFKPIQHDNGPDTVVLGSDAELKWISHLLQLSDDWLKQALTTKVTETRGDRVLTPYNMDQALDTRDAIAKALYSRLFTWLVERVNLIICRSEREKTSSLAVLDIFGFEDFHHNSFEQLCINYANETLQFFFNQHIFRLEQKEYTKENIDWSNIEFRDNQPVIDLLASKPAGILTILDDECSFPKASDQSFLEKCHFHHASNTLYDKPRMSVPEFHVYHFAGKIKYNVDHFLEKNKDTLRSDVVELLCESKNTMIAQMFKEMRDRLITKTLSKTTGRYVTLKPRTPTVAAGFTESLLSLIDTMSKCHPYFVRCLKPNNHKAPMQFERTVVLEQLRYTGMLETIKIRKMGFPIRVKFPVFIDRYRYLLLGQNIHNNLLPNNVCKMILSTQKTYGQDLYRIGATKVFMKESFEQTLDEEAKKVQYEAVLKIQTCIRAYISRRKFLRVHKSSVKIQAAIHTWLERKKFLAIRNGIIRAQAQLRMRRQRKKYLQKREEIRQKLEKERLARKRQEEQEQMEREEKLKRAKALEAIANLEIPAELAYVYSKLDDWQCVHQDRHVTHVKKTVAHMDQKYKLPEDINSHAFSKYTNIYFKNPNEFGMQLMPIKNSLTQLSGEDNKKALAVFKVILRFMNDANLSVRREKTMCDFIVQMGLEQESLRDEIYCQVANQCWNNQNPSAIERGWSLMGACLSAFPPSNRIFKYILKFVSDVGFNGFKVTCQHKALQCANIEPQLSRIYPPCLLEWRAIQQHTNMALEARLPDGSKVFAPVESWTSGELFSSHLMQSRGLRENSHGWTVALQEDTDQYELMGYDYVLDLISEMEIAPGFPVCKSYFLVSSDRTQEPLATRRNMYRNLPHSVDRDRFMFLQGRLPSPLKVETSKLENRTLINKPMEEEGDGIELSMTSALNRRPTEIMVDGLSNNKLNFRYTKRKAPGPPGSTNGHLNGLANGDAPHIFDDDRDINLIKRKELGLAESRLNSRYGGNAFSNGSPRTFDDDLNSNSKLNARYVKSKMFGGRKSAVDKIRKREARERALERESASSELSNGTTGHDSDWSHWVEDVFNNALNEHVDALSDARSMENRIKGGGKGVPGPGIQPAPVPPLNLNLMSSANGLPMSMPLNSAMTSPAVQAGTGDPFAQLQQQMAAQQLAQQQAMMQNYLQQLMQAQAQAQAQAQVQAQAQAQAQQQMQAQAQARQQQALMQQILQLQQQQQQQQGTANMVAGFGTSQAPTLLSPSSSMNSVGVSPFQTPREPVVNGTAMTGFPTGMSVQTQETSSGVPKKVYKIKTQFEGRTEHKSFQPEENGQTFDNSGANHLHLVDQKTESESHKTRMVNQGVLPPPPPPPSFQDNNLVSPRMAVKPPAPPPPPPVMQSTDSFDRENGTFTFTDKKGRARTVRIGRVVWPPPVAHEAKQNREVGRLEIDENVAKTINDQHGAKKLNKKPVAPPPEKKEMKRTKSLAESVHLATLQVLEQKLGKKETDRIPPPKPPTPEPLPPPLPQLPPPPQSKESTQSLEVVERKVLPPKEKIIIDYSTLEKVTTKLYPQGKDNYMTYSGVPWDINVRKEVFYPRERLENPNALHMIFCQVVEDVYNNGCIRISKEDRIKMRGMLEGYGINHNNFRTGSFSSQVKKIIVDTAKEWPCYFCRLFPVAGQDQYSHVRFIGINHTGVRYITRERSLIEDALHVQEHIKFEDIIDVVMPTNDTIQINTKNRSVVFYTNRARQLKNMIDSFLHESDKGNKYVVAVKDYITRESTLLSFKRGDIIKMVDAEIPLEDNWLYGSLNGVLGYFPAEYIRPLQRHEVERSAGNGMKAQITETVIQRIIRPPSRNGEMDNRSETSQGTVVPDGKFSMMEYALMNFRESKDNFRHEGNRHFRAGGGDWSWKEQADMVKWTRSPIQASLLRLISSDLNKLALECFLCIMKFMGDYPMAPNQTEYDCAFKILKTCHKFPELRDEIYCQLCKQTTNNRSMKPRSCIMGWRLLSIVACYCDCSETMRPYLFKYLETTASDTARSYSGAAAICLQNLRKTFKYGGRKNVPLKEEIFALCEGRVSKRFSFIYSGSERGGMLQVKPSMVVKDAIEDICNRLDIFDPVEMEEYTLFLRTKEHGQNHFVRLRSEEYILDITAELVRKNAEYNLVFQRTVWYFPFRETDNMIYNELMFFQCLPDYLEGLLVSTTNGRLNRMEEGDIPFLGALLFKAFDRVGAPTIKDLTYLLPKNLTNLNISSQQWVNRINDHMAQAQRLGAINCKAKFVSVLSQWPLFGSIFFMVKNAPTQPIIMGTCILAVNRNGIQFLKENSHESVLQYQFSEIMSTRRYRSDSNQNYLDMKLGNLMVQKIVRVETDQGSDISNLIGQYMQVINRHRKRPLERSAIAQN